jgi:hypothetical protein
LFEEAAGLALLAAVSPPAILVAALYLASARPGRTTVFYVAGGFLVVALVGSIALIALRAGGLSLPRHHQTRYGLRLGLGVLAIIAAVLIYRRRPSQKTESGRQKKPGLVARLAADPKPLTAFVVGIVMFGPSVTFIAAVQVVASSKADLAATVGAMAMIVVLTVAFAWLPAAGLCGSTRPHDAQPEGVRGLVAQEPQVHRDRGGRPDRGAAGGTGNFWPGVAGPVRGCRLA